MAKALDSFERVVITYGTFDLLHYGHIRLLKRAKELGTFLIVGLSTDEFNKEKEKEAVIPYAQRKEILEAIQYVDMVIPESNWEQKIDDVVLYGADIFVMGHDWKGHFDYLDLHCEVRYLDRTEDISTTNIKTRLSAR